MEFIIVAVIVGFALFFVVKSFTGMFRSGEKNSCSCGCQSCGIQTDACDGKNPGNADGLK